MKEAVVKKALSELFELMTALPLGKAKQASTEGLYNATSLDEKNDLSDCLDQLRVRVKYLMFDLEASRRENRYLRQMLEHRRRPNHEDHDSKDFKTDL